MLKSLISSTPKLVSVIALSSTLIACGGAESVAVNSTSNGLQASLTSNNNSLDLSGTVGDSPIIKANITIKDSNGNIVATSISDDSAHYSVNIPEGTSYPLIVSIDGGINTVTNEAPLFDMVSVIENNSQTTANINSFTTLITHSAQAMGGALNLRNISLAKLQITNSVNFGLNNDILLDVVASQINEENVASFVKASVTLGEWLNRTYITLSAEDQSWTQEKLVIALAADLVDGTLDGKGAEGSDAVVAATANILSAQVLVENLSQSLQVTDINVMTSI